MHEGRGCQQRREEPLPPQGLEEIPWVFCPIEPEISLAHKYHIKKEDLR